VTGRELIEFIDRNIPFNEKGERWSLARYQRAVFLLMFARYFITRIWSEIKKSGKTFLAACIVAVEMMTRANAEAVCIANDEEQAQSRVFATCVALFDKNPTLKASLVKVTQNEIRLTNGSVIRAVASDYKGAAGGREFLRVFDELWAYDSERMTRLWEEMRPPPTEKESYTLVVSYAGFSGESTVLEKLYQRGLKGKRLSSRYPVYADGRLFMFWSHTGRQPWHTKAYFENEAADMRPNQFRRLHRNEWVSSESTFILPEQWDNIVDESRSPILTGGSVCLGIDIGVKSDTSGVVAVSWDTDGKKLVVAFHRVWKPTKKQPVLLGDVKGFIKEVSQHHAIQKAVADPSQAYRLIEELRDEGIVVEEFTQSQANGVKMGETLFSLVKDRNLIAYKSAELREHVLNAVGVETPGGVRMVKGKATKKIDAAIALAMACVAAIEKGPGGDSVRQFIENNAGIDDHSMSDWTFYGEGVFNTSPGDRGPWS